MAKYLIAICLVFVTSILPAHAMCCGSDKPAANATKKMMCAKPDAKAKSTGQPAEHQGSHSGENNAAQPETGGEKKASCGCCGCCGGKSPA